MCEAMQGKHWFSAISKVLCAFKLYATSILSLYTCLINRDICNRDPNLENNEPQVNIREIEPKVDLTILCIKNKKHKMVMVVEERLTLIKVLQENPCL